MTEFADFWLRVEKSHEVLFPLSMPLYTMLTLISIVPLVFLATVQPLVVAIPLFALIFGATVALLFLPYLLTRFYERRGRTLVVMPV